MHKYKLVSKKGEGTFSEVIKAQSIKTGEYVAIKRMKNNFESIEQVNNLREIQALVRLSPHPNIVKLLEVVFDPRTGRLALVFELLAMNLYDVIRGRRHYLPETRVKGYMYQLLKALDHMHRNRIFHRDIKPENILCLNDTLKLADFGSCRGIYSKQPYTEYISTRWYRAPECLLTDGYYGYRMDIWGAGCVFFEIMSLFPLFPGASELDQVTKVHAILGTPAPDVLAKMKRRSSHTRVNFPPKKGTGIAKLIPHASTECVDLIMAMLMYNPEDRPSAQQALLHVYFRDLREADKLSKGHAASGSSKAGGHGRALPNIRAKDREKGHGNREKDAGTLPTLHKSNNSNSGAHSNDQDRNALPSIGNTTTGAAPANGDAAGSSSTHASIGGVNDIRAHRRDRKQRKKRRNRDRERVRDYYVG